jgi:hypothetical protein
MRHFWMIQRWPLRIAIKRVARRPPVFCLLRFIYMFLLHKTQEEKQKKGCASA